MYPLIRRFNKTESLLIVRLQRYAAIPMPSLATLAATFSEQIESFTERSMNFLICSLWLPV